MMTRIAESWVSIYNINIILRRIAIKKEHDEPRCIISTTQLLEVYAIVIDYA